MEIKIGIREINKIIKNVNSYSINELIGYLNIVSTIHSGIIEYSWNKPIKEGSEKRKLADKIVLAQSIIEKELTAKLA